MCEKNVWNPSTCACENNEYLGSIIDDSLIPSNKIIERTNYYKNKF